jgi:hypothetical protein
MGTTRRWTRRLAAGLVLVGAGCRHDDRQNHVANAQARGSLLHPAEWSEAPAGASVALHAQTQITNGVAARMCLHDYDFVPGTDQLNYRGKDRARQIAAVMPYNRFPVVVERLPAFPELAETRRRATHAELVAVAGPVPIERVVVGASPTVPLQGVEAGLVYDTLLQLTGSAGTVPGTGARDGTSGGNFGGAGGGANSGTPSPTGGVR